MIQVSFQALFLAYLCVSIGIIFVVWLVARRKLRKWDEDPGAHRLRCSICVGVFEDRTSNALARCPHCGTLNERAKLRGI